jgi:hypothetical protein
VELILDALAKVDSELADRHRELGSDKHVVLGHVKARLSE